MGALFTHVTSQSASALVVLGLQDFPMLFASTIVHRTRHNLPVLLWCLACRIFPCCSHQLLYIARVMVLLPCVSLGTPEPLVFVISHAYMALVMMQLLEQDQWPASSAINSTFVQI